MHAAAGDPKPVKGMVFSKINTAMLIEEIFKYYSNKARKNAYKIEHNML